MWRLISYGVLAIASTEAVLVGAAKLWMVVVGVGPSVDWATGLYVLGAVAAAITGTSCGYYANEYAEAIAAARDKAAEVRRQQEREDRKAYLEQFGVSPEPDDVVPITKGKGRERA